MTVALNRNQDSPWRPQHGSDDCYGLGNVAPEKPRYGQQGDEMSTSSAWDEHDLTASEPRKLMYDGRINKIRYDTSYDIDSLKAQYGIKTYTFDESVPSFKAGRYYEENTSGSKYIIDQMRHLVLRLRCPDGKVEEVVHPPPQDWNDAKTALSLSIWVKTRADRIKREYAKRRKMELDQVFEDDELQYMEAVLPQLDVWAGTTRFPLTEIASELGWFLNKTFPDRPQRDVESVLHFVKRYEYLIRDEGTGGHDPAYFRETTARAGSVEGYQPATYNEEMIHDGIPGIIEKEDDEICHSRWTPINKDWPSTRVIVVTSEGSQDGISDEGFDTASEDDHALADDEGHANTTSDDEDSDNSMLPYEAIKMDWPVDPSLFDTTADLSKSASVSNQIWTFDSLSTDDLPHFDANRTPSLTLTIQDPSGHVHTTTHPPPLDPANPLALATLHSWRATWIRKVRYTYQHRATSAGLLRPTRGFTPPELALLRTAALALDYTHKSFNLNGPHSGEAYIAKHVTPLLNAKFCGAIVQAQRRDRIIPYRAPAAVSGLLRRQPELLPAHVKEALAVKAHTAILAGWDDSARQFAQQNRGFRRPQTGKKRAASLSAGEERRDGKKASCGS